MLYIENATPSPLLTSTTCRPWSQQKLDKVGVGVEDGKITSG